MRSRPGLSAGGRFGGRGRGSRCRCRCLSWRVCCRGCKGRRIYRCTSGRIGRRRRRGDAGRWCVGRRIRRRWRVGRCGRQGSHQGDFLQHDLVDKGTGGGIGAHDAHVDGPIATVRGGVLVSTAKKPLPPTTVSVVSSPSITTPPELRVRKVRWVVATIPVPMSERI